MGSRCHGGGNVTKTSPLTDEPKYCRPSAAPDPHSSAPVQIDEQAVIETDSMPPHPAGRKTAEVDGARQASVTVRRCIRRQS